MTESENSPQLSKLLTAVATLTDEVGGLKREVTDLKDKVDATKDMVEAWQAVKAGGKLMKWIGGCATGLAAAWLIMKSLAIHLFK